MGRRKGKRSEDGQYVNVPYAMIKSEAWRSLSGTAMRLWFELHCRYNGGNNGRLTLSYAEAADLLGIGKASAQRAYQELVEKGFLAMEQEGNWYHRRAHQWRLTTKPMQRAKGRETPTQDWRSWRAEKTKRGSEMEPSGSSVVPFENPKPAHGSISEPVRAKSRRSFGSETEH
ncbi:hypothetical protein ROA7450_01555 [Roseovarius albus]|uniref:Helix-turn-helix domain-containing protein n=1 Tax=Roseovarius albus TaxID=1247867 RepID=A0A1X6YYD0_9RHOB|nr:helix-turn-helix domain-containing protein [Roseovarius albus]SLN34494.1 hypothetical protein ROA7450_01555 [Roseovarius albus]